jgi:hypothetical protein
MLEPDQTSFMLGDIPFGQVDSFGVDWAVEKLDGWSGSTKPTSSITQRARRSGGWRSSSYASGRSIAASGKVYAPDARSLQDAFDRLNRAIPVGVDQKLTVSTPAGARWVLVQQSDEILVDTLMPTIGTWSIQVDSTDWRKFGTSLQGVTALPSTSGGLVIGGSDTGSTNGLYTADQVAASANAAGLMIQPSSTPGTYDLFNADGTPATTSYVNALSLTGALTVPFVIGATVQTGQVPIENAGNTSGPVVVRIDGPCVGPIITHSETGRTVAFSDAMSLRAGEYLLIDMEAHTVLANGQASRDGYITKRGWSSLRPGKNTWSFTARQFNSQARMTVTAVPSWR